LLRNLPNKKTARQFLSRFNAEGFQGRCDTFFLPTTMAGRNLGFAFIRFRTIGDAENFVRAFNGVSLGRKALEIVYARNQVIRQMAPNNGNRVTRPTHFDEFGRIMKSDE